MPSRPSLASACGRELQLAGRAGVLLVPQGLQQIGDPAVDGAETMEPRVAGAAEGDQGRGAIGLFPSQGAVVDDERCRREADAAEVTVAGQDPFPAPAEVNSRPAATVVAELAQPAAVEIPVLAAMLICTFWATENCTFCWLAGAGLRSTMLADPTALSQNPICEKAIRHPNCPILLALMKCGPDASFEDEGHDHAGLQ